MAPHTPVAVITGASRGLGLALARELAARGWRLVINARGAQALEAARTELSTITRVIALPGDITDNKHRSELVEAARAMGGVDVLVNNASTLGPSPRPNLLDYPIDALEHVYRTNVIAPLALTQALWPFLAPDARIFNISSDAGAEAYAGWGGYGSSKAALEQITAVFAAENPERRIYWVDPGDMRTQMHQEAFPGEDIGDRPLPEESVPGFIHLIEGNLPSGRYQAHAITAEKPQTPAIRELRAALTVQQFEDTVRVFRDQMGLSVTLEWSTPEGRGVVLDAGRATLEIVDGAQAETIDHVEVGQRVSGPVRLALEVGDVEATAKVLQDQGTTVLHEAVLTPWGDYNQRVQTPEGVQITLYQAGVAKADEVIS